MQKLLSGFLSTTMSSCVITCNFAFLMNPLPSYLCVMMTSSPLSSVIFSGTGISYWSESLLSGCSGFLSFLWLRSCVIFFDKIWHSVLLTCIITSSFATWFWLDDRHAPFSSRLLYKYSSLPGDCVSSPVLWLSCSSWHCITCVILLPSASWRAAHFILASWSAGIC